MLAKGITALLFVATLLLGALAGCASKPPIVEDPNEAVKGAVQLLAQTVEEGLAKLSQLRTDPLKLDLDVTINVVLVGIDGKLVDEKVVEAGLPKTFSPDITYSPAKGKGYRSGLMHNLQYAYHEAPAEFAKGLFEFYPTIARQVDIPRDPNPNTGDQGFLQQYDSMYQLNRAGSGKVWLVDAEKAEAWIEEHRDQYGLRFKDPEYTVFFLDSWTQYGLWKNAYYWYEFVGDMRPGLDTRNMRVWGGTFDFLFMDYSAAPNNSGTDNSGVTKVDLVGGLSEPAPAPEGTAYNDPPMWHYNGDTATIGQGGAQRTVKLSDRVHHAMYVATNIRLIGDYAFRPVYKENYQINVHLWHDGRSIIPKDNLDKLLDPELFFGGLKQELPWAKVDGTIKTYVLPGADPGMDRVLNRAKAEAAGTHVPIDPILQYVDANKEKYKVTDAGVFNVMALLFILEGDYTFFLPHTVGGVAFGGPDGTAWGTISSVNDYRYTTAGQSRMEYVRDALTLINAHEIGHFFGLPHAHDGSVRTATGYAPFLDHTWSSTKTVMSYRTRPHTTDTFHRDVLARPHALENFEQTLRNVQTAYRALGAQGIVDLPAAVSDNLRTTTLMYNEARALFNDGKYEPAVYAAIEARRTSELAMELAGVVTRDVTVGSWTTTGVNSAGAKNSAVVDRPAVVPTGVKFDYKPFMVSDDVERITVRATWTNSPASWGDFFIGWTRTPGAPVLNGPVPMNSPVRVLEGGVHDDGDEGPSDGAIVRDFTLDMDMFPSLRRDVTLHLGAGTQGSAVNGAYKVDVIFTYRDALDGTVPAGAA